MITDLVLAGGALLGALGVSLAAAGAHLGGGEMARTAWQFMLIHAAVLVGLAALEMKTARPRWVAIPAILLFTGPLCFAADLTSFAWRGAHIVSGLAPTGGMATIAGWVWLLASAIRSMLQRRRMASMEAELPIHVGERTSRR